MKKKVSKKSTKTSPVRPKIELPEFFYLSLVLSITLLAGSLVIRDNLPPEIPLLYGLAEGEAQLSQSFFLIIPSVIGLAVLVINTILSLTTKNIYFKKTLFVSAFAVNLLTAITTVKIILLVGSF